MTRADLIAHIRAQSSMLCVGLDPERTRLPEPLKDHPDALFAFNKAIIDATAQHCVAYKPNLAFYEAEGLAGWEALSRTIAYIRSAYPKHFAIADAKRGDIGNTARMYAEAFFTRLDFDALTVAPYMGSDSVRPFLEYPGKWAVVLGLTSNPGALDFEELELAKGHALFLEVMRAVSQWGNSDNTLFVVGATRAGRMAEIRGAFPEHFFLVPGIGAQGGNLQEVLDAGATDFGGLLINASRSILYASSGSDFAQAASEEARKLKEGMRGYTGS
ncbi:orotidine-5'-phosphate decarboxylase [bacterium]|nr:orotidine-5'-phosphate decarboxylase [bacterium]